MKYSFFILGLANLATETDSAKKENVLNSILANIKSGKVLRKTGKTDSIEN